MKIFNILGGGAGEGVFPKKSVKGGVKFFGKTFIGFFVVLGRFRQISFKCSKKFLGRGVFSKFFSGGGVLKNFFRRGVHPGLHPPRKSGMES